MAEKIVSPGVFTREKDLSFLPQGVAEIGACIIGSTRKGPAFVPTLITSMADFETQFGAVWEDSYVPYTVQQYMKSAGQVTIVRVLGDLGHEHMSQVAFKLGETVAATKATRSLDLAPLDNTVPGTRFNILYGGVNYTFESDHANPVSTDQPPYYFYATGSTENSGSKLLADAINAAETIKDAISVVGSDANDTLIISASAGGANGNNITFKSASAAGDYSTTITLSGGKDSQGGQIVAVGAPTRGQGLASGGTDVHSYSFAPGTTGITFPINDATPGKTKIHNQSDKDKIHFALSSSLAFPVDGATPTDLHQYTMSFDTSAQNYIGNIFGEDPQGNQPLYLRWHFKKTALARKADTLALEKVNIQHNTTKKAYSEAYTPSILSQDGATLFKVYTMAHGDNSNTEIKIAISNVKYPGDVPGSDFGSFSLTVRKYWDGNSLETDTRPIILEQFNNVSLDPDSPNYFARAIGDRYVTFDDTSGKLLINGDWPNKSKYIRVANYKGAATLKTHVPWGFGAYAVPFDGESSATTAIPPAVYVVSQSDGTEYNSKVHFGVNFADTDTVNYHSSISWLDGGDGTDAGGGSATGSNTSFTLTGQHCPNGDGNTIAYKGATTLIGQRQFIVGFQGGYDGFSPARVVKLAGEIGAGNTQGWNLSGVGSTASPTNYASFKKAINAVSNPDEFDINMLVIPGVDAHNHSAVVTYAKNMCEDRGDTFYIMDCRPKGGERPAPADAVSTAGLYDTNYGAMYYPWVRILDTSTGKLVWVPPSVVMAGVIAFTDKVSHEWFAPAGLLRGGLSDVVEAETRLTHDERDTLYEGRVNPIATFPGQGVVVWGQKTLQGKPSALDRVNVRRLLIKLKKFIASSTKFLVFEQNTAATRNRFLNIVNPFLEQVQQNSGLSAFKVVMDETNNTPDLIDRNILFGQIYIQPTRTAEFIILDFNIMPTGATFPE